ncbi:MAG: hypothetical protein HC853_04555 [Anaerolineae bacterium]|nr:hypothetical protein [Anaerolineae bacterium]
MFATPVCLTAHPANPIAANVSATNTETTPRRKLVARICRARPAASAGPASTR